MRKKISKMSVAALIFAVSIITTQSVGLEANATDITGITGNNGVFNINPSEINGEFGLREYENFNLSKGDVANLIFKYGAENVSKFVNLVDNQININGLVNTVRDGQFYNGEAIFVSPNGMVVGESGVLNVGSLSVLTPTAPGMKLYKNGKATLEELGYHGNANITINGKILSRGNIGMVARDLTVGNNAAIIAGGANNNSVISTEAQAEDLFNALVNTGKNSNTANVEFRTYNRDGAANVGMNIQGDVTNYGNGDIVMINRGAGFTTSAGKISASGGDVYLTNGSGVMNLNNTVKADNGSVYIASGTKTGAVNIGANADLTAQDLVQIVHNGSGNTTVDGNITSNNNVYITERGGDLNIEGTINNRNGKIAIAGNGTGLNFGENAVIRNDGQTRVANTGRNGLTIKGDFDNSGSLAITNRSGDFNITEEANLSNKNGKMNLTNTGNTFNLNGNVSADGQELLVQNTGAGGFNVNGSITSGAKTYVQNTNGALNITGSVKGVNSDLVYVGNTGAGGILVSGENASVKAENKGKLQMVNTGAGGINIDTDASVLANGTGTVAITNRKGDFVVDGNVQTEKGNMNLTNVGNGLNIARNATVGSTAGGELIVQNTGADGLAVDGTVKNTGHTVLYNTNGNMNLAGKIANSGGKMSITNKGKALNVADTAYISNDSNRLYITNKGTDGLNVQGTVVADGHVLLTNRDGGMDVSSNVTSNKANVVLTNSGNKDMDVSGTVKGEKITVTGKGSDVVLGNVITDQVALDANKKVVVNVENGNLLNAGSEADLIKSKGTLYVNVSNGTIGEDVVSDNPIGADSRDLTKSINVNVAQGIKAFTKGDGSDGVINMASQNADMNVDRIKANGKVMLLTGKDHSILNASTNLEDYANVNGTTVQMISGGSIGTADKALHFRQTDASQESNVMAVGDVNLHHRGEAVGEDVNFGVIKSKTGSINADIIKDGVVNNAIAAKDINIKARRQDAKLEVKNKSNDTGLIKDYFD